jgi:hypothetical protein
MDAEIIYTDTFDILINHFGFTVETKTLPLFNGWSHLYSQWGMPKQQLN